MIKNKAYEITSCRVCQSKKLEKVLSLGDQYLSDFVDKIKRPEKYPLEIVLCNSCHLLQLKHTAPQSSLYTERYGYKSGINQTMRNELKGIVKKSLQKLEKRKTKIVVVDIGANDGTLLHFYPKHIKKIGVEPVKKLALECAKQADVVINDFFHYKAVAAKMKNEKADIVSAISCFYDIEEPNTFIEDVKKILNEDGIFVIQQNYLVGMLEQNAFDNIVHEHLEYYSLLSLENLLSRHGMEVFDVELSDINGGSFRTYIAIKGKKKISLSVLKMRKKERGLKLTQEKVYKDFAKRVEANGAKLYKMIKKLQSKDKKVYVYGASTRGNTLLQYCKLDVSLIPAAVERNEEKFGKIVASVDIPIISEEQARREKPEYMLVLPWFFKEEFLKREKKYLKNGGHFIFPLPKVKVY